MVFRSGSRVSAVALKPFHCNRYFPTPLSWTLSVTSLCTSSVLSAHCRSRPFGVHTLSSQNLDDPSSLILVLLTAVPSMCSCDVDGIILVGRAGVCQTQPTPFTCKQTPPTREDVVNNNMPSFSSGSIVVNLDPDTSPPPRSSSTSSASCYVDVDSESPK